jgi:putative methionine-R-sulfoxide reductase with GAF domain
VSLRVFAEALRKTAEYLTPHRLPLVETWAHALDEVAPAPDREVHAFCEATVDRLLARLSSGEVEGLLSDEAVAAAEAARSGVTLLPLALAIRVLDRCCLPFLLSACPDPDALGEALLALDELGDRRLEILLRAQEEESARRLIEAQEQADRAAERARELKRANEDLQRSHAESQHRADQIALLSSVARRIAPILEPERLMEEAAHVIRARMNHTFVAVVVLDDDGVLIGRWAGREGVGRQSAGRTHGPAGGIIGRALRKRAPQVVDDVGSDSDYHPDVPGTRSEMVIPLLGEGGPVGAIDFQSETPGAFGLDDVAAGEALADFLVVALRNARLFTESRRP